MPDNQPNVDVACWQKMGDAPYAGVHPLRHHAINPNGMCPGCGRPWAAHGWLPTAERRAANDPDRNFRFGIDLVVCPGDHILALGDQEHPIFYPFKKEVFMKFIQYGEEQQ